MKTFKVRKGQKEKDIEKIVLDVRNTFTQKGTTTLKYMYKIEEAVEINLAEIRKDIKTAKKELKL